MKKRITSLLLGLLLALSLVPPAFAASPALLSEFFPSGKISTPKTPYLKLAVDEAGDWGDTLTLWVMTAPELRQITAAGEKWDEEHPTGSNMARNRFGVEVYSFKIQTDARIDGGSWQYSSAWDDPGFWSIEGTGDYVFAAARGFYGNSAFESIGLSDVDAREAGESGENLGFLAPILTPFTDHEGNQDYHFNLASHSLGVRCRLMMQYQAEADAEVQTLFSDWSPETVIGVNGNQKPLTAPTGIEAPTLSDFTLTVHQTDGMENPDVKFFIAIPDSVYDGQMYCEAEAGMFEPYRIEPQIRVDGGDWVDFYIGNPDWIFDGLRGGGPSDEYPFTKDSQVEVRARIVNSLGMESPWSNIVGTKPSFVAHDWAQGLVGQAQAQGLIPDSLQGADLTQPINRREFAAVCVKLYEALAGTKTSPAAANPFKDTNDTEVLKAYNVGITAGTSATTFSPEVLLNREQAATMLTNTYKKVIFPDWTSATNSQYHLDYVKGAPFADDGEISEWAKDSVYFMAAKEVISGMGNNKFGPKVITNGEEATNYATREQALVMAVKAVDKLAELSRSQV